MLDDLLWIPARKIQEAVSMMSNADGCQAACYQHPHLRIMIAGACTCLDSIAGDTLHLTRDPLLSTRSSWGYLKKPAGSWGNGSTTWCWTITAHSHRPSQSCPAVTTHISTPWKHFSIPAWMTWIIILNAASTKLNFHNMCLEKVVKSGVSHLGVETYADLFGGMYITIGSSGLFEFKQSPGCGSKWLHKLLKTPASRVMMAIIPDDGFLLAEASQQPITDSFYIMLAV